MAECRATPQAMLAMLLCVAAAAANVAHALQLTKEENAAVLRSALVAPDDTFKCWAQSHGRPYLEHQSSPDPLLLSAFQNRKSVWLDNARYAALYNTKHHASGHWLGLNSLADRSFDEYKRLLKTQPSLRKKSSSAAQPGPGFMYENVELSSLPRTVDWRNVSAVSEVKNQGQCGSCWAFATTGAIEGINAIYTHNLVSLSEQELVDCDREVDQGCSGGMMDNAYEWVIENGGLHTEEDWPYTATESFDGCDMKKKKRRGVMVTIDGWQALPQGEEPALLKAAAHQPVAVAIEADSRAFQLYMGGVLSDPACGSNLNHGVLVVGYGGLDSSGTFPTPGAHPEVDPASGPYWLVKNSWGDAWGAEGYIKLQMGFRDNITGVQGLCGITLASSFPLKHSPNPPAPPTPPPSPPAPVPPPSPRPPRPTPPPGPPHPVACDQYSACPAGSTCCCLDDSDSEVSGCTTWGCCPMEDAVCCADHLHCCPSQLPVCDNKGGRCSTGTKAGWSLPWFTTQQSIQTGAPGKASSALTKPSGGQLPITT